MMLCPGQKHSESGIIQFSKVLKTEFPSETSEGISRRRMWHKSILLVGFVFLLLTLSTATGIGQEPIEPTDSEPTVFIHIPWVVKQLPSYPILEQEVADLINQYRRSKGLPEVTLVAELIQAARRHSRDMADNDFFSHTGSDGSNAGQRMRDAGYDWATWGEIIAVGCSSAACAVNLWKNSSGHNAIMLSSSYEDFGVGYAWNPASQWGHYWTVVFGRR
jgi:uncharacterized protein YkwD